MSLSETAKILPMIQVTVNGAPHRFDSPLNVDAVLERLAMAGKKIAVEKNGEIVPKSLHQETFIEDGDQLEIVVAVGGG
jgi:sulfur carrier protein